MVGLMGLKVFIANFYDNKGEFAGSKVVGTTFTTVKKKTFEYLGGMYNYDSTASRSRWTPFPYLVDYYFYSYQLYNPDPLVVRTLVEPKFTASNYNSILKSDILEKLNKVRDKGWLGLFTLRNIIIFVLIAGAIWYFASGGSLTSPPSVPETVNNASLVEGVIRGRGGG